MPLGDCRHFVEKISGRNVQTFALDLRFQPPVIGHRGANALAPENTLASFRQAYDDGVTWVETDVKLTYDGVPILMHDDLLDRTTNGKGAVADMKWSEVQQLDAGSWFGDTFRKEPVPHLDELLHFVIERNMRLNLEIKPCPGRARATVMVALIELSKVWPEDRLPPLVSSFDIESLVIASSLHPECPRGLCIHEWMPDWPDLVRKTDANSIHLNTDILDRDRVQSLIESHLPVLSYTVNDPVRAKELLNWGVTAVFSDNPKEMIKSL